MNSYKQKPPRLYCDNSDYFLTFNSYKRRKLLIYETIPKLLLNSIEFLIKRLKLEMIAYVILPEHMHLLLKCEQSKLISNFLRRFKTYTSKKIKKIHNVNYVNIWQPGTYDHVINDEDDYWNHIDYIHFNPVKHGLVKRPEDWEWSSFRKFVKNGEYNIGWGWDAIEFKNGKKQLFLG